MSGHTWTVEQSAAGPIAVCRDASGAVVSRWSNSEVGIVTHISRKFGPRWVRPTTPVPQIVRELLSAQVAL